MSLYDAAVLWAVACKMPRVHKQIESHFLSSLLSRSDGLCFACNLLNVAGRELWIHGELSDKHKAKQEGVKLGEHLLLEAREAIRILNV